MRAATGRTGLRSWMSDESPNGVITAFGRVIAGPRTYPRYGWDSWFLRDFAVTPIEEVPAARVEEVAAVCVSTPLASARQ